MRAFRILLLVSCGVFLVDTAVGTSTDPAPRERVDAALRWLADHQHPDGRWDADGFWKMTGKTGDGSGSAVHDVGVTGLALLAFLGDGHTPKSGTYRAGVKKGRGRLGNALSRVKSASSEMSARASRRRR